jgi:hypothetical protein
MGKNHVWVFLTAVILLVGGCAVEHKRPLVGTVRWDGLFEGSKFAGYLMPAECRYRLPFYTTWKDGSPSVNADRQSVMDEEIAYAKEAGLNYWAFCYYYPNEPNWAESDKYNYGLKRYLSSKHKKDINFCLIISGGGHEGPTKKWQETVKTLAKFFTEPTYQTVAGGRPLVFVFIPDEFIKDFGSTEAAKQALNDLRKAAVNAGCRSPYIVCMVWHASQGADYVKNAGYDAISAYTHLSWDPNDREYPYSDLAAENASFWDECKATGNQVIPIVNTGWNNKPMRGHYAPTGPGPWYTEPTMTEWKNHLKAALDWVHNNPSSTEPNAIVIYSWIELTEGGWLVPTLGDGTARIKATSEVLKPKLSGK